MLSDQQYIQLQAYLDDELEASERDSVKAWISSDTEAAQALATLKKAQAQLQNAKSPEPDVNAAWQDLSKRLSEPVSPKPTIRFRLPLSAAAAILILGMVFWASSPSTQTSPVTQTVEMLETDMEETSPIVYIDAESGWTVVWVEPAGNELAPAG